MRKTILYKLFGLGAIPKKVRPILEKEGIVLLEEGIGGRLISTNVKGPMRRHLYRSEGFTGSLVITKKRILCFTYWKRQINIAVEDPKLSNIYVSMPDKHTLSISFEASLFRNDWSGIMEFRFNSGQAQHFLDILVSLGATKGSPADIKKS